jgi:hypothetical protein
MSLLRLPMTKGKGLRGSFLSGAFSLICGFVVYASDEPPPDPLAAGWNGESVCERLYEDEKQRILRCTFPPGGGHEKHYHAPHFGYVLVGGKMRIRDDEGERVVDLPDNLTWDSEGVNWHEVLNVGNTTSVYLIVEPK